MLGMIGGNQPWEWSAFGKHPSAKDFISIGSDNGILKAFGGWLECGYAELRRDGLEKRGHHSWRFWIKGPKRKQIICGIGRDSSDSLGRPYPILVLSIGNLRKWEKNWDLLPFSFERTWAQMEGFATGRFDGVKQLEQGLYKLPPPKSEWGAFESRMEAEGNAGAVLFWDDQFVNRKEFSAPLPSGSEEGPFEQACSYHRLLKEKLKRAPNGIFMGGPAEASYIVVFGRALVPEDVTKLWSME